MVWSDQRIQRELDGERIEDLRGDRRGSAQIFGEASSSVQSMRQICITSDTFIKTKVTTVVFESLPRRASSFFLIVFCFTWDRKRGKL